MASVKMMAALEAHELLLSPHSESKSVVHVVCENSEASKLFLAQENARVMCVPSAAPPDSETYYGLDGAVFPSITAALSRAGVDAIIPSKRVSPALECWANRNGIFLIGPAPRHQRDFENKLYFDDFLRRAELPVPERCGGSSPIMTRLVVQRAESDGCEGTFFASSWEEAQKIVENFPDETLLVRKFIPGRPLGVTIVVSARDYLISAVREQCYAPLTSIELPSGIQWVPRSSVTPAQEGLISRTMGALAGALQCEGFRGAASVDFILGDGEVFIIECNPRFSAATPQLALHPELLHGLDFIETYVRACSGQPLHAAQLDGLPDSEYRGAFVSINAAVRQSATYRKKRPAEEGSCVITRVPESGRWSLAAGEPAFLGPSLRQLGDREAIFIGESGRGRALAGTLHFGSLYTEFPIFNSRQGLHTDGSNILSHLVTAFEFEFEPPEAR